MNEREIVFVFVNKRGEDIIFCNYEDLKELITVPLMRDYTIRHCYYSELERQKYDRFG